MGLLGKVGEKSKDTFVVKERGREISKPYSGFSAYSIGEEALRKGDNFLVELIENNDPSSLKDSLKKEGFKT